MDTAALNEFLFREADRPAARLRLAFQGHHRLETIDEPMRGDISGVFAQGDYLWMVSDETLAVERLTWGGGDYGDHRSFHLDPFFELPEGGELDLEGICVDGGWLWLIGSHSLVRKRAKREHGETKTLRRLARVEQETSRHFLGRVPLADWGRGPEPVAEDGGRRAAMLPVRKGRNQLLKALAKDRHLAPFLKIPSKDNGLDIEGIAARGDRVFLGLRGPVLRGMAVMLELAVKDKGDGRLKLRKASGGERYRKHFVELGGMGIRDMTLDGARMLLLVGPTMDLDGPTAVLSLPDPFGDSHAVAFADAVEPVLRIPHGPGTDHAEGVCRLPDGRLLVVYDSPDASRLHDDGRSKDADVFTDRPWQQAPPPPDGAGSAPG